MNYCVFQLKTTVIFRFCMFLLLFCRSLSPRLTEILTITLMTQWFYSILKKDISVKQFGIWPLGGRYEFYFGANFDLSSLNLTYFKRNIFLIQAIFDVEWVNFGHHLREKWWNCGFKPNFKVFLSFFFNETLPEIRKHLF